MLLQTPNRSRTGALPLLLLPLWLAAPSVLAQVAPPPAPQGGAAEVPASTAAPSADPQRGAEALLHARQVGLALLENAELDPALSQLSRAVELSGGDPLDRFNLGLGYLAKGDLDAARREFEAARVARPELAAPSYALGVLALRRNDLPQADQALQRALELAPHDPATLYHLGVVEERLDRPERAANHYRLVLKLGWSVGGAHFLASLYRHARILLALGRGDEARRELALYQDYFARVGKPGGEADLQTGRLLWPIPVPVAADLLPPRPPAGPPQLARQPEAASGLPGALPPVPTRAGRSTDSLARPGVWLADLDGNGLPELLRAGDRPLTLFRNLGHGRFQDVTRQAGPALARPLAARQVAVGDSDNDGDLDLLLAGAGPARLLRNRGNGTFEEVSRAAGLAGVSGLAGASWVDIDQEGDLDLLLLGGPDPAGRPQRNRLFLNRGDGTFFEQRGLPGLTEGALQTRDLLAVDLDEDEDVDLLLAGEGGHTVLLDNQREGRWLDRAPALGLADGQSWSRLALSDLAGAGRWDLLLLGPTGLSLRRPGPGGYRPLGTPLLPGARDLALGDLQLDGREEVVLAGPGNTVTVLVTSAAGDAPTPLPPLTCAAPAGGLALGDVDRDGDLDLVVATGAGSELWSNETPDAGRWLRLVLHGRKNNALGRGVLVELRAGSLYLRRIHDGSPLLLGIDGRSRVDTVRIRWPNGLFQHAVEPAVGTDTRVEEVQELAGSCPFIYSWDGSSWRFINDFLGAGGLGLPAGRGRYLPPDDDEYLLIRGEELQPRAGLLTLQLTEELRAEQLYLDQVRLHVLDHPAGTSVVPDERFTIPGPRGDRRYLWHDRQAAPPLHVLDDFGVDVRELVAARDERMAGSFILPPETVRGMTEPHGYVLELGDTRGVRALWLVLTGWAYWAGGSSAIAAEQNPRYGLGPVVLEVQDEAGRWQPGFADIGFPSGKTKAMPVDLTPLLRPSASWRVRLRTTLRLHWDQMLVVRDPSPVPSREAVLPPAAARLYARGFSRRIDDRLDLPERFVFSDLLPPGRVRFDQGVGLLTRYGDVTPLLLSADDELAVFSAGDAVEVSFDGRGLPPLPPGWVRDYLLYSVGWNKDGDLHVGRGASVEPLPFHAMPGYPYPEDQYPRDERLRRYRELWNTRPGRTFVEDLRPVVRKE